MGLEEVRIVQTLKFQGGITPSRLYPELYPNNHVSINYLISDREERLSCHLRERVASYSSA